MNKSEHTTKHLDRPFIGIDVAKESLVIFVDSLNESFSCPNAKKELAALAKRFSKLDPQLIVLEASGGYEKAATEAFSRADLPFAVVFPRRVRQFAHGLGIIAKNAKKTLRRRSVEHHGIRTIPLSACHANARDGDEPANGRLRLATNN